MSVRPAVDLVGLNRYFANYFVRSRNLKTIIAGGLNNQYCNFSQEQLMFGDKGQCVSSLVASNSSARVVL